MIDAGFGSEVRIIAAARLSSGLGYQDTEQNKQEHPREGKA